VSENGDATAPAPAPELLVITGMSGAGRSTAGDVLEDLGWYVVDNLPPQMVNGLVDLTRDPGTTDVQHLAVTIDVRGRSFFAALRTALGELGERGVKTRLLFLDAADEALVRRFESVRRPHPLQGEGRLLDGIVRERHLEARRRSGARLAHGSLRSDELRARGDVAAIDKAFHGHIHEAVVCHVAAAVGEGEALGFRDEVHRFRRVRPHPRHVAIRE